MTYERTPASPYSLSAPPYIYLAHSSSPDVLTVVGHLHLPKRSVQKPRASAASLSQHFFQLPRPPQLLAAADCSGLAYCLVLPRGRGP